MRSAERESSSFNVDVRLPQRFCLEHIPDHNVHHTRECTNRVGEKGIIRIHDVCGRHMFYFVEVNN